MFIRITKKRIIDHSYRDILINKNECKLLTFDSPFLGSGDGLVSMALLFHYTWDLFITPSVPEWVWDRWCAEDCAVGLPNLFLNRGSIILIIVLFVHNWSVILFLWLFCVIFVHTSQWTDTKYVTKSSILKVLWIWVNRGN